MEAHSRAVFRGNNPKAIVLDLVRPNWLSEGSVSGLVGRHGPKDRFATFGKTDLRGQDLVKMFGSNCISYCTTS